MPGAWIGDWEGGVHGARLWGSTPGSRVCAEGSSGFVEKWM